jgi:glycosyltransferase involved in cell wall biosynthesis
LKISIITISYNDKNVITETIESVLSQNYRDFEYILIDGGSNDGSLEIIKSYGNKIENIISENDSGIYNAINKGIKVAKGEVIGLIHAGDVLYDSNVLSKIADSFIKYQTEIIYGHSIVYKKDRIRINRKNISPKYKDNLMKLGWFPSHQSTYFKSSIFLQHGYYNEDYKIAADYEFLLRLLYVHKVKPVMVDFFLIKFYLGGESSKSLFNIFKSNLECYKAWKNNNLKIAFYTIPLKIFRKFFQVLSNVIKR